MTGVQTPDAAQRAVFNGAADYLAGDASWLRKARSVQERLDACSDHVSTLRRRVHRETVNIGVIGITGAGKSTLLRRITGLGEEQIPSNEYTSTTAAPCRIFHDRGFGPGRACLTLQAIDVFCPFEDLGAVRLGLVDLPGSGEAGLDVHGRFQQNMRNDVDMLC